MYYPRFTKAIIHHFLIQEKSLSWRNKIGMHTSKGDYLINSLRFVSAKESTQIYGAILPECLTSPAMKESKAYKTYLGYATCVIPPKMAQKLKKASPSKKDNDLVPVDEEPVQKGKRVKRPAKKFTTKPAAGVVIREAPMKEVRKKSLRDFHKTHPSGSSTVAEKPPSIDKITPTVTSEGTGDKPRFPDVTEDDSTKSESESWGNDENDNNNDQDLSNEDKEEEFVHTPSPTDDKDDDNLESESDDVNKSDEESDDVNKTKPQLQGPSIPTNLSPKKAVERETEETTDKEQYNFQRSTAHIPPSVNPIPIPGPDVLKTLPKPNIPYPSRRNDQKSREKASNLMEKIFQIFQDLRFDISFADALLLMPRFAPTIRNLLMNKEKLLELAKIPLNENCSAMLLKKLPEKLGDPGKFLIPCDFPGMDRSRKDKDKDEDPSAGSDRGIPTPPQESPLTLDWYVWQDYTEGPTAKFVNDSSSFLRLYDRIYLQGGVSTMTYTTSTTKKKAAQYDLLGIKDKVPNIWSPVKVAYDRCALWGISHGENIPKDVHKSGYSKASRRNLQVLELKSYQKKINVTKPDTTRLDLKKRHPHTPYKDPQGFIYVDDYKRNRLMRSDELYKFCDGTLTRLLLSLLKTITRRIDIEYLPKRIWSTLEKKRAYFMIKDINKLLKFDTSARNLVKEILLKLNLPDHRIFKDGGEGT
ncbi:hypothetical protein Tco_0412353 [Tanacetum coccineum]